MCQRQKVQMEGEMMASSRYLQSRRMDEAEIHSIVRVLARG